MRSTDVDQVLFIMTKVFLWLSVAITMTFGRSKTLSNILIRCPIASDEINNLCVFLDSKTQTQKVLISSEAMGHHMKTFNTVLKRPKVILLVFESRRNISVMLSNIWSTSVDLIVD